jgi:hypothetical protein
VFRLGAHRVVCGDATDAEVLRLLTNGDERVRLILTDEPYNVRIAGYVTSGANREFAMASGEMSDGEFLGFNEAWIRPPCLVSAKAGSSARSSTGAATNGGMGSLYRSQHELLPLFKKGIAPSAAGGRSAPWRPVGRRSGHRRRSVPELRDGQPLLLG